MSRGRHQWERWRVLCRHLFAENAEMGGPQLHPVGFDLHETLRQTIELLSILATCQGINLRTRISPQVPSAVVGDPARISHVLITLVRAGFTRIEKAEIRVTAEPGARYNEKVMVEFRVAGAGLGQAAAFLEESEFNWALSKRLAEMMGGRVWVYDTPGAGTAFHFTVNLGLQRTAEPRPLKLLVAGDAAHLLRDEPWLREEPWQIDSAGNVRMAVQKAVSGAYDVILIDLDLPEMDGDTATRRIRVSECYHQVPAVPIVALISGHGPHSIMKTVEAGCNGHLTKPLQKAVLIEMVKNLLPN